MGVVFVETDLDGVQGEALEEPVVHGFHDRLALGAPTHVRLVGDDHELEPSGFEFLTGFRHAREEFEILQTRGGIRFAVTVDRPVEHAVSIQKNGALQGWV
jgi:hypothetical protein